MSQKKVNSINSALEVFEQVRAVNRLLQGLCARIESGELSKQEAEGLYLVLEWQSQQMLHAEGVIKTGLARAAVKAA